MNHAEAMKHVFSKRQSSREGALTGALSDESRGRVALSAPRKIKQHLNAGLKGRSSTLEHNSEWL